MGLTLFLLFGRAEAVFQLQLAKRTPVGIEAARVDTGESKTTQCTGLLSQREPDDVVAINGIECP